MDNMSALVSSPVETRANGSHQPATLVAGSVCGLTWAAALRGWMIQLAGADSDFTWVGTFLLVLVPGVVFGSLLGRGANVWRTGGPASSRLMWAPLIFALAIADPKIFVGLIQSGTGGGALGVIGFGLAGGYVIAGRRRWLRIVLGGLAGAGILLMATMNLAHYPASTAKGVWVALYGASLLAIFCLACAFLQGLRPKRTGGVISAPGTGAAVAIGAVTGLAWATALRCFMAEVAGPESDPTWAGTVAWVLVPGVLTGPSSVGRPSSARPGEVGTSAGSPSRRSCSRPCCSATPWTSGRSSPMEWAQAPWPFRCSA